MGAKATLISSNQHFLLLLASLLPLLHRANPAVLACDFFHGSWIYDDSYPLYDSLSCPFIDPEFDCRKYGRPDELYLKQRWRPSSCELPSWDYIEEGGRVLKDMDRLEAFGKGLTTWAKWVVSSIKTNTKKVFFQSISPTHYRGKDWGEPGAKDCGRETRPLAGSVYPGGSLPEQGVVKDVLRSMRRPVDLLDITLLSQLRKDGHPSEYSGGHPGMDCSHWCVAGLPDTWNLILYAALV